MRIDNCLFCGSQSKHDWFDKETADGKRLEEWFECPHCGCYEMPNSSMLPYVFGRDIEKNTYYVSCYLNETRLDHNSHNPIRLTSEVLKSIVRQAPKSVEDKVEKILQFISNRTSFFGELVELTEEVIYSSNRQELDNLIEALSSLDLIDDSMVTDGSLSVSLTLKGVGECKDRKGQIQEDKCFIAMWFSDEMNRVYDDYIALACLDVGYQPIRVDKELYNGDVTDKIISSIRTTAFTIADLSGNRGGVYYEAGFAKGLGKEVIFTCQDEWFNGDPEEGKKVHFDVDHINTIVWKKDKLEQFKEDLTNRIVATIGKGSFVPDSK